MSASAVRGHAGTHTQVVVRRRRLERAGVRWDHVAVDVTDCAGRTGLGRKCTKPGLYEIAGKFYCGRHAFG